MIRCGLLLIFVYSSALSFLLDDIHGPLNLYVSPTGSDHNNGGSAKQPFGTLQKAILLLDEPRARHRDIIINLMKGYHDLNETLKIRHSLPRKVTIQAYKNEEVYLTGGKRISGDLFSVVTDNSVLQILPPVSRGKVLQANLTKAGITNLGKLSSYGFNILRQAGIELFCNGQPFRLARWPNDNFINITSVIDPLRFTYDSDRAVRWTKEEEIWAYGYWNRSWADKSVKIRSINTSNRTITLATKTHYGLKTGHFEFHPNVLVRSRDGGGFFRVFNVLAELDQPGEFYVDRKHGMLYMWPPATCSHTGTSDAIYVSVLDNCVKIDGSANLIFRGFTLEACRHFGISGNNVNNITIQEMEIRNTGSFNAVFDGDSRGVKITRSNFHDGDGGIILSGGNRKTLTPSNNEIADSVIWRFSRETSVGANALSLNGVGGHVHHNDMHTGQYTGIRWNGNDHVMEYNNVHDMCQNCSDCGAIHAGRDWTARGNVIRYNYIYRMLRFFPGADNRGVMLDDQFSSATIENNIMFDNEAHIDIGGGRDNIVRYNTFYNATAYTFQVDHRGDRHRNDHSLLNRLHAMPYKSALWAKRYPQLAIIDTNKPAEPMGNEISENVIFNTQRQEIYGASSIKPEWYNMTNNRRVADKTEFYSSEGRDFRPRCALLDFYKRYGIPLPIPISQTGPRYEVGPVYNRYLRPSYGTHQSPLPCTTNAPAKLRKSYLPDGSRLNSVHKTQSQGQFRTAGKGCWIKISKCPEDRSLKNMFYDAWGSTNLGTDTNMIACLDRAETFWQHCGANVGFPVTAYFHPKNAISKTIPS